MVPGARPGDDGLPGGVRRITVPAPRLPGTGGYRAVDPWRVQRLLDRLRPDVIEVSDRLTLRGLGAWAARRGVPSVVISHERLDRLLTQFLLPAATARRVADLANARMADSYDTVVCSTGFARAEFDRIGAAQRAAGPARGRPGHVRPGPPRPRAAPRPSLPVPTPCSSTVDDCRRRSTPSAAWRRWPPCAQRGIGAAGRGRATGRAGPPGTPSVRAAGDLPRLRAGPTAAGRAAGLGRRVVRPRSARDVRAVRAGGAGLRHPGGGLRARRRCPSRHGRAGAAALDSPEAFAAGITTVLAADEGRRRAMPPGRAEQFGWPSRCTPCCRCSAADHEYRGCQVPAQSR